MNILQACEYYKGVPYVWGGDSAVEGGFDCSGYAFNVLNLAGVKVRRLTAQGYYNLFKSEAYRNCNSNTVGALLFFGKSVTSITHIAIAAGDGWMWESIGNRSNTKKNKGKGVTKSRITRRKDLVAIRLPNYPVSGIVAPEPTLLRGMKNERVKQLQRALNGLFSAGLVVDGSFGANTEKAVKVFQSASGLTSDGIYGNKSYNTLKELIANKR